jgi:hypothetical protein
VRLALGIVLAVFLGFLIGRTSAPSVPATPPKAAFPAPGPTSKVAGVGVGFPRTREGVALATATYQQAFADRAVLSPQELHRRVEVVATPQFASVMLEANRPGAARLRQSAFGKGLRHGVPSAYFGVPVAYRVLSFSPSRAIVQTWGFTLLGNLTSVEPTAYFGLARTELVWMEGDWKIAGTRASFGPTPRLASRRPGAEGLSLVELTQELSRYGVAP